MISALFGGVAVNRSCALVWALLAAILLGGCQTDHVVRITALRDPSQVGRTYWLLSSQEGVGRGHLEYRLYERLAERALRARGYARVDQDTVPHLVILLDYGVGPPEQKSKRWGWAVPHKTTKTVSGLKNPLTGMSSGSTITTTSWSFGSAQRSWTEYTLWLRLSAVEGRSYIYQRSIQEIWNTVAYTSNQSRDLQRTFPVLLASAMDYFGVGLHGERVVRVPRQSPRVDWLRTRE